MISACGKDEQPSDTGASTAVSGDGDGDSGETGETGGGKDTGTPDTGDDETGGFVPNTDIPGANTCDPWAQDCPEDEKCAAYNAGSDTWNANKCVPLLGSGQTGDACTYNGASEGTDDCDVGFMCYYTNEEAVGICIPLCTGNPDDPLCEEQFNCSISNDGSLLLCVYACDPLLQDCAQEGSGCFWDGAQFNCDPAGDIMTNEPCGYINDCLPGHLCADAEALPSCQGSACCASWCEIDNPTCPVPDTECIAFYDEGTAPPGLENVGLCALAGG
ncbi:hypothetical protein ENSA5_55750 [Enhygromyxa salina]|uniref:Uncharacterized protein n=1 Tax=Enhygromyxa salina TaxID=215803 RepID=A0A2S9XF11_9BACT|nr:ribulose phosphate epimerase [Enhygromyxa salina]PRP91458.1 hypothetical protein ENSA5_55750 [Enhygromyxa salina]